MLKNQLISFVIPAFNEGTGIAEFHNALLKVVQANAYEYEIIYCDDGSRDNTAELVKNWHQRDSKVHLVKLSRNFGKEAALTAGISVAKGDAIITLDADGQHPVSYIPAFIEAWQKGAQVVVGLRTNASGRGFMKKTGPRLFNKLFNAVTGQSFESGSSDYRLIIRSVQTAFLALPENDRATRDLIDWLGFNRAYVRYKAAERLCWRSNLHWPAAA
jgi:glycosyltransferase involved in cell wall biosynthesis